MGERSLSQQPHQSYMRSRLLEAGVENFEVHEKPTWNATLTIPGLSIESLDRDGKPKIQSLMLLAGLSRLYALNIPYDEYGSTFLDWATLTDGIFAFLAATEISVTREVYDRSVKKKSFDAKFMLGHVSKSSVSSLTSLHLPGSITPILEQTNTIVTVSKSTRKAIPLPDWFKERYQGHGAMDKGLRLAPLERPSDTFTYTFKVAWSDTDNYNHTNFASYSRFAVDALHAALRQQATGSGLTAAAEASSSIQGQGEKDSTSPLKGITKDIVKNGLKNVKIVYLHECLEGQEVDAHIWQETGAPFVVRCVMESCGNDICHVTLEYFDGIL